MAEYSYNKLKGRIIELFDTQTAFATAIGKTADIVSAVLNGRREMSQSEIETWANVLQIEPEKYHIYFFKH